MGELSVREAGRKYGLSAATVSRYVGAGMVRVARRPVGRGSPLFVYECDVARAAALRVPGRGRGRRAALKARMLEG